MELDDPGFHHSIPTDFRRHSPRTTEPTVFPIHLKEVGLVREHTTQRTNSTHVLTAVRDPTRLELVTETVRAVLEEVARTASYLLTGLIHEDRGHRHGRPVHRGMNPARPKTRILTVGGDACRLLERTRRKRPAVCSEVGCTIDEFTFGHRASLPPP